MKKSIAWVLTVAMMLSMVIIPAAAANDTPVTTLTVVGVDEANTDTLVPGDQVTVSVTVSGLDIYWAAYQLDLKYNSDVFDLELASDPFGDYFDTASNCADIKSLSTAGMSLTTNTDATGSVIITGASSGLLSRDIPTDIWDNYAGGDYANFRDITLLTATFTVKAGVSAGEETFYIATGGTAETPFSLTRTEGATTPVIYATSTDDMTETVTIVEPGISLDNSAVTVQGGSTAATTVQATAISNAGVDITTTTGWSISGSDADVTIGEATGVITVPADAEAGTYTVSHSSLTQTATLTVNRAASVATSVEIYKNDVAVTSDTIAIPTTGASANEVTYTAKTLDQYGADMSETPTFSFATATSYVTATNGKVSVDNGATANTTFKLTATSTGDTSVKKEITITVVDIAFTVGGNTASAANTVTVTTSPTYGDSWSDIVTINSDDITAKVGAETVTGTYSLDVTGNPDAGNAIAYKVLFNNDTYTDVEVCSGTVAVATKAVTVTGLTATDRAYDATTDVTLTGGTLSGVLAADNDVTAVMPTNGTVDSAAVGTAKTVTISEIVLTGTGAANYTLTQPTVTVDIAKATITGFDTTAPTHTILANATENTSTSALKAIANGGSALPATVTVTYGGSSTAVLPIAWADATDTYDVKGGTYTYKGTVTPGDNFNEYTTTLNAIMTVTPVTATLSLDSPAVTKAQSDITSATDYAAMGLPTTVTVVYDNDVAGTTYDITDWDMSVEEIQAKDASAADVVLTLTPTFTADTWATLGTTLTFALTIIAKYPVTVSVTTPTGVTYGETLADMATPTQTAIANGADETGTWTYLYEGTNNYGTEYSSSEKPTYAGTYTVTATLVSDTHSGSATSDAFTIAAKTITDSMIAVTGDYTYNGTAQTPTYTVSDVVSEVELIAATDYTATITDGTDAGTYTDGISLEGKGNYTGTATADYTIAPKSITSEDITISDIADQTYTGGGITPVLFVKDGTTVLTLGTDYTVAYANNTDVTEAATATITGIGNYVDSPAEATSFTIVPLDYTGTVTITGTDYAVGTELTANAPAGGTLTYQWNRVGEAIETATASTYTLTEDDAGKDITVTVASAGNYTGTLTSAAIEVGKTALTAAVTIAEVEGVITVSGDVNSVAVATDATDYTIQWLRDGVAISGATDLTYTVTDADKGCNITVAITAAGETYTGTVVSDAIAVAATVPEISLTLTASSTKIIATWTAVENGATISNYTIQLDDGEVLVLTADNSSYTFTGLSNGISYTVKMTAINSVGASAEASQSASPKIITTSGSPSSTTGNTDTETTTNDDGSVTATVDSSSSTSNGVTTTTVDDDAINDAIETAVDEADGETSYVEIAVTTKSTTDTVAVELSTDAISAIADSNVDSLVITSDLGSVEIPSEALAEMASQAAGDDIVITVATVDTESALNTAQQVAVGDAMVVDLSVLSDGVAITSFGGHEITITIPYELQDGESAENIVIWYIDDLGNITAMETVYDEDAATATFKTTHFSVFAVVYDANVFTDVDANDWYYNAVMWAVSNGITNGTSDTTFSPDSICNRAQAVTFLWNAAGNPVVEMDNPFTDVAEDAWYYQAVLWAVSEGITDGTSDTTFSPDADCTRDQIVTFLYRAAGEPEVNGENPFSDVSAESYYYSAVLWAVEMGITTGTSDTTFSPSSDCTRSQIVTFLYRNMAE